MKTIVFLNGIHAKKSQLTHLPALLAVLIHRPVTERTQLPETLNVHITARIEIKKNVTIPLVTFQETGRSKVDFFFFLIVTKSLEIYMQFGNRMYLFLPFFFLLLVLKAFFLQKLFLKTQKIKYGDSSLHISWWDNTFFLEGQGTTVEF